MTVHVLIFASLAQHLGMSNLDIDMPDGATVRDALDDLSARFEGLSESRTKIATAVNMRYVGEGHLLSEGDELALIPPVSGG